MCDSVSEGLPLQQLSDGVGDPIMRIEMMNGQDVRMGKRGDCSRFLLEPAPSCRIAGHLRRQDFDGHVSAEPSVSREIDLTHPARAQRREDLILTEMGAYFDERIIAAAV